MAMGRQAGRQGQMMVLWDELPQKNSGPLREEADIRNATQVVDARKFDLTLEAAQA